MIATMTIHDLAREASRYFERRTRPDGETFTTTTDDRPEWVHELAMEAHGDFLPDDWRYDCIAAAVEFVADNQGDPDDASHDFADGYVDTYNASRYAWLASNLNRAGYVDEATETFGPAEGIAEAIGRGQYLEAQEVYASVVQSLSDELEAREEEADND